MSYALLVGNGLSIPFNGALGVPALTKALVEQLGGLSGGGAEEALAAHAGNLRGQTDDEYRQNFEALLGPIEAAADALPHLQDLADFREVADDNTREAIKSTTTFLAKLHRVGLGIVLKHIAEQSVAPVDEYTPGHDDFQGTVGRWASKISELAANDDVAIGTLNYDGLLHAATLGDASVADLASGLGEPQPRCVVDGGPEIQGRPLRTRDDIPAGRLEILNLHGSLGWLREPETDLVWKFNLRDLRAERFWDAFAEARTQWTPTVVLGDRKAAAIRSAPFSLAYEIFVERLIAADRWMIVGYGFGDEPLNQALGQAFRGKNAGQRRSLQILVIDYGRDEWAPFVAELLGVPPRQVKADVSGIPDAIGGAAWVAWVRPPDSPGDARE